jgi:hypothetical protein
MIYSGIMAGSTKFSRPFKSIHLYLKFLPTAGFHVDPGTPMVVICQESGMLNRVVREVTGTNSEIMDE